jgi:hypothetical protein
VWLDLRTLATTGLDIFAQRVSSAGARLWAPANGVAVSNAAGDQSGPQIVADGSGGAIIAWQDNRNGDFDVFVQRLNGAGVPQWAANGVAVTGADDQINPHLVSDGAGGAIIAWEDFRNSTLIGTDIFAQRVNGAGLLQWGPAGRPVSTAAGDQFAPQIVADGSGGAIIAWQDTRGGSMDVYAQRLNSFGQPLGTFDGVAISAEAGDQTGQQLIADGSGGAIIAWEDRRSGTVAHIYAQRVDHACVPQWATNGVAVSLAANSQLAPQLVSDGGGGAIIAWQDDRNEATTSNDIYAQGITADGTQ